MLYCQLIINDPIEDKAKRLPEAITNVAKRILRDWSKNTLPKHFRLGAARRYGYMTRSVKYQRAKQKRGMLPALVWSGRARDKITSPGHFEIKGSKGSATGRIINVSSIRYFWMDLRKRKRNPGPNMAAETTRLSKDEKIQIKETLRLDIMPELKKTSGNKKIVR